MKKIIVLITAIFLSSNLMIAQKQTISASHGYASTDQAIFTMSALFTSIASQIFDDGIYKFSSHVGPLTASYHRILEGNKRFSFGISLAYDNAELVNENDINYSYELNAITLAPEGKFKYLNPKNMFNIYGFFGLGFTVLTYKKNHSNETNTIRHVNLQFTPLGLEFGGIVKGFLELGIGYKGIICGGISINL